MTNPDQNQIRVPFVHHLKYGTEEEVCVIDLLCSHGRTAKVVAFELDPADSAISFRFQGKNGEGYKDFESLSFSVFPGMKISRESFRCPIEIGSGPFRAMVSGGVGGITIKGTLVVELTDPQDQ